MSPLAERNHSDRSPLKLELHAEVASALDEVRHLRGRVRCLLARLQDSPPGVTTGAAQTGYARPNSPKI